MSIELAEHMANFAESGNQQRIYLQNGSMLQGWIMEINEDALLISTGFNEKSGQDSWVNFAEMDLSRLEFWDIGQQQWLSWQMPGQ
ncbi:MAG: hypothetical protein EOO69_00480 [Moraxellaceae bacterium]|nr:MAG: hypothetical protein EOO69_00480 [Moraxellaceae bacterium]